MESGVGEKTPGGAQVDRPTACQLCHTLEQGKKSLVCKRCKKNYCIACLKKDEVEYVILQKQATGIMWFCPSCEESVEKSIAVEQLIEERCQLVTQRFEERLLELESKMERKFADIIQERLKDVEKDTAPAPSWADMVKNAAPKEMKSLAYDSVLSELDERKSREKNIILFGLKEAGLDTGEERQQKDMETVRDVFKTCKVRTNSDSFARVIRLGKYDSEIAEDPEKAGRPVLVTLQSMELKTGLFKKIAALHDTDKYTGVRIANDLTKTEREKERELYKVAKGKNESNPSDDFTYKVRGPPWARKVVRIAKTV